MLISFCCIRLSRTYAYYLVLGHHGSRLHSPSFCLLLKVGEILRSPLLGGTTRGHLTYLFALYVSCQAPSREGTNTILNRKCVYSFCYLCVYSNFLLHAFFKFCTTNQLFEKKCLSLLILLDKGIAAGFSDCKLGRSSNYNTKFCFIFETI